MTRVFVAGVPHELGQRIGKGGEGEVFRLLGNDAVAIKVYTVSATELSDRRAKIRALLHEGYSGKTNLVAFPLAEVTSPDGKFLGFSMRLVRNYRPLHELYAPGERKVNFPAADFRFLVRAASNVARAIAAVHRTGCVIGDINHSGVLVSQQAIAALIDADSFQLPGSSGQFLCKVGVPEYTPPELQGRTLVGVHRTANHDAFGLAVVVFQLLFMGRHPFVGSVRKGDVPPIQENIAAFRYVYTDTRDVGMDQPPGTPSVTDFFPLVAAAFERAFSRGGVRQRPTAEEWASSLDALEVSLAPCDNNKLHYIPRDASDCAWCEMERQIGNILFLPHVPAAQQMQGRDPGTAQFALIEVWQRIVNIRDATNTRLSPKHQTAQVVPSEPAKTAKQAADATPWGAYVVMMIAVGGFLVAPKALIVWVLAFIGGWAMSKSRNELDGTPFRTAYTVSEQHYARELQNWNRRNGVEDFLQLVSELERAKNEYELMMKDEVNQINRHAHDRRNHQLHAFLDSFPIARATIKGIGDGRRAVLASYGVDTAADVSLAKIASLPGFGEASTKPLLEWRQKLEGRFVYRHDMTAADHAAIAQIRAQIQSRAAPLRQKLTAGPQNLTSLAARVEQITGREDSVLVRALHNLEQARCDLKFLGLSVPAVTPAPSRPHTSAARPQVATVSPRTAPASTAKITCPRCGHAMVKRMARRGRNVGSYFWGCGRYPVCKGTRNI